MITILFYVAFVNPANSAIYSYYDGIVKKASFEMLVPSGKMLLPMFIDSYGRYYPSGSPAITHARLSELEGNQVLMNRSIRLYSFGYSNDKPVYQFGSFRLIRGQISQNTSTKYRFIPEVGSKVTTLDNYLSSKEVMADNWRSDPTDDVPRPMRQPSSVPIYNLPGYIVPTASKMKKATLSDFPQQPAVESSNSLDDKKQPQEFIATKDPRIAIRFGDYIYSGTLDPDLGEIIYDDIKTRIKADAVPRPPLPPWLMEPKKLNESVYELRCGRLIPGFLHELGKEEWLFVPDIGGTVIDAREYLKTYQPWSRRISNLPGKFVPQPEK